jgi:hypothetical protein
MKDAKGHGSNKRPIPGHPYHSKTNAELQYIMRDAGEAAKAARGLTAYNPNSGKREDTEGKYLDQVNDAATVMGYRARGGKSDAPADALAGGGAKSAPAPTHDAMGPPKYEDRPLSQTWTPQHGTTFSSADIQRINSAAVSQMAQIRGPYKRSKG